MRKKRLFGSRAGSSMVEFALGSGILVTIFAATFQYGYIFYQYNALVNAVNNGAHYAALYPYENSCETGSSAFNTAVQNVVVYGNPGGTGTAVVKNLTTANVSVKVNRLSGTGNTCGSVTSTFLPGSFTVSINGANATSTNFKIDAVFGSFTPSAKPAVSYPFLGVYTPPTT
jgi:Flp pilus assembly protein TadG